MDTTEPPASDGGTLAPPRARRRRVIAIASALATVAIVLVLNRRPSVPTAQIQAEVTKSVKTAVDAASAKAAGAAAPSVAVYRAILPSLVFIRTDEAAAPMLAGKAPGARNGAKNEGDSAIGTGVVISAEGTILTANHVIADATVIHLTFADGTNATGRIVKQEPDHDIAVLAADRLPGVVVPAVLGSPGAIGDETFAVGHPLGLVASLSAGVISGLDRSIPHKGGPNLDGLIQFDAAVNPGSSGGPLLNRSGQVIGIVTALANPSDQGFFVGIGFAVPIATAGGAAGSPPQ